MLGMINRALQCFVRDTYSQEHWLQITQSANLGFDNFEAMLNYPDEVTLQALRATSLILNKPLEALLEDIGTYIASHPNISEIRNLLRLGGENFVDFLFSLNETQGRAQMALPDLHVPSLKITSIDNGIYQLICESNIPGLGHGIMGTLRTMADDYGALVYIEHSGNTSTYTEKIIIHVLEDSYAEGRTFNLSDGLRKIEND